MSDPAPELRGRRGAYPWIAAAFALLAAGLLVWALVLREDLAEAQRETEALQAQVDQGQERGTAATIAAEETYAELSAELGATSDDLAAAEREVEESQAAAEEAERAAAEARAEAQQATGEVEKAEADADKATAELRAAEAKGAVAADCARAYVSAIASLFEGGDAQAAAAAVREQLVGITDECKAALKET